jgi:hypothetical protein
MKPSSDVVNHIGVVEQLANQLTDLEEPISEQAAICKIMCFLPQNFRHMVSAWDNIPQDQQTIKALTHRLLKEEARNRIQCEIDEEGEKAFFLKSWTEL